MKKNCDTIKENRKCFREGIIMSYILQSDDFVLSLDTEIFEADIKYPCNTILEVSVKGCLSEFSQKGYEQKLEFENDIDQTCLKEFCYNLWNDYEVYLPK